MATIADDSNLKDPSNNNRPVAPLPRKHLPPPPRPPVARRRKSIPKSQLPTSVSLPEVEEEVPTEKIDEAISIKETENLEAPTSEEDHKNPTECKSESLPDEKEDSLANKETKSLSIPEPTYASVKKPLSPKKLPRKTFHVEITGETHEELEINKTSSDKPLPQSTPPPIPESRPPPEDYEGIFSPEAPSIHILETALPEEPSASHTDDDVFGDHLTSEYVSIPTTVSDDETILNEPPYEQVFFKTTPSTDKARHVSVPPVIKRPKLPPPKPKMRPPPRPSADSNEVSGRGELKSPAPSNGNTVVKRTNKGSASKGIDIIKRKSQIIKKKSLQIFHNNDDKKDSPDASPTTVKRSTSKPASKAKSFSFPHRKDENISQSDNKVTAAKPVNITRHQSTPGRTDKPSRVPPPRPAMPAILQNRLLSPEPKSGQKELPPNSNKTGVSPSPISSRNEEKHVDVPDEFSSGPEVALLNNYSNSLENQAQVPLSPTTSEQSENTEEKTLSLTDSKTTSKPARPPPMKRAAKKSKGDEKDESFFDVIKSTGDKNKPKAQVDETMKHYITDESYYIATHDYQPTNFTDLSFAAGEKILVLKRIDDDLLFGRNEDGEEGPFPEKYVSIE